MPPETPPLEPTAETRESSPDDEFGFSGGEAALPEAPCEPLPAPPEVPGLSKVGLLRSITTWIGMVLRAA